MLLNDDSQMQFFAINHNLYEMLALMHLHITDFLYFGRHSCIPFDKNCGSFMMIVKFQ
jgi:hypothetical protein